MHLRSVNVKNYRSLEDISFGGIEKFNVIIGRNNAGKSSVFGAISFLGGVIHNQPRNTDSILTHKEANRSLEIGLTAAPSEEERLELISKMCSFGSWETRKERLVNSHFFRQIAYTFRSSPGSPEILHLNQTKVLSEDNHWCEFQKMTGSQNASTTNSQFVSLDHLLRSRPPTLLGFDLLDYNVSHDSRLGHSYPVAFAGANLSHQLHTWPMKLIADYFKKPFFFNPFRHSAPRLPVIGNRQLEQNGANLAQVLHTIHNADRKTFYAIERFIHGALPDIGTLQTPLIESKNETEICFKNENKDYLVRLHDMGGGIEQLLMTATVLLTTKVDCPLFLEEPESHLHAGAQRYLIEKLYEDGRQVFITTHSSTFINLARSKSLHQVELKSGRSDVRSIDSKQLNAVLGDLGIKNSDVLLSDAVIFVEGPSDKAVLEAWCNKLGLSLAEHNITILPMGGGGGSGRETKVRREVLEGISSKASVPHIFILDRDERSQEEIDSLAKSLGNSLHLLERREIENYLLTSHAVRSVIIEKLTSAGVPNPRAEKTPESDIDHWIRGEANDMFTTVLVKRIKSRLPGLKGGILPRELLAPLIKQAESKQLEKLIVKAIQTRCNEHIKKIPIKKIVSEERKALTRQWKDSKNHLLLAPGTELLESIFKVFETQYVKEKDAKKIAGKMKPEDIAPEIQGLIKKISALPQTKSG